MPSTTSKNHYELLGITREATEQEIRQAYKNKARLYHPDKAHQHGLTKTQANDLFNALSLAYETLIDAKKRSEYNITLDLIIQASSVACLNLDNDLKKAISSKNLHEVMALIAHGAPIHRFILMYAIENGSLDIVKFILKEKPDIHNNKDHFFRIPLAQAVILTGNVDLLIYFEREEGLNIFSPSHMLDTFDKMREKLLTLAVHSRSETMIRYLLEKEPFIDAFIQHQTSQDYSYAALKQAVRDSNEQKKLFETERLSIIRFLIENMPVQVLSTTWEKLLTKDVSPFNLEVKDYLQQHLDEQLASETTDKFAVHSSL